ncbi:serine-protein kinase ATM isoform X2 [Monomorium pharaonis]|uniref:serine-protein kinase ATM isoform X2 n=1 Tax=Monomorium pharaonis TaxID=307658 RepID=UPI00063F5BB2|nr:serine-protein kinase ATM isoform X2 [Monomorium pharaonis]
MSRLSERIADILKLADSTRVTDKRRCISELLDLYQNDDVLQEICQNTERKAQGKANWPYLIYTAHKLITEEAEKPGKETNAKNNDRQSLSNFVIDTIRRANERSAVFLRSSDIVAMILQILDSKVYVHYQDTYLRILVKYILPKSINHRNITADQWRDLLIACTKLYGKAHLQNHKVLDGLQMIVDYSFPHTNLLPHVKNMLLFLENVFENVKASNDEQLMECFYKLSSSVCKQITTESKIALCKFSESISMDILRLNGSEEKYRLLLIFLQIHHPGGISSHDDGAYAFDWDKWRSLLRSMFQLIQENCKLDVQWCSFIQFASEVIKQIMDNSASFTCSLEGFYSQAKRRRTMNKIENIVDLVTESNPEEVWPLLRILTETLRKYPQCLRSQDLAPLLQRLTELAVSRDESIMNNLYNLAAVLMENEMSNEEEMQDATIHWSKIWDMLLRSLGANQNEESGHLLIRRFIRYNRIPNANALLRLYLTKAIRWSLNSVHTLRRLCERISLPVDASTSVLDSSPSMMMAPICDRTRLLEWLLNMPWQKLATRLSVDAIEDICTLSVNLVLSSRHRQNTRMEQKSLQSRKEAHTTTFVPHRDIHLTDLSQLCHASLIFKVELLVSSKDERVVRDSGIVLSDTGSPVAYVQEVLNFLRKQMHDFIREEDDNDENKNTFEVYMILMKLAFVARLLSALKQLGILTMEDTGSYGLLINVMEKQLKSSFEILTKIDWTRCKNVYLFSITKALRMLYGATYDTEIAKIIVSASTVDMIRNIFDLMNLDDNYCSYDYYEDNAQGRRRRSYNTCLETSNPNPSLPREGAIRLYIVEALSSFCALHIDKDIDCCKSMLQKKIMHNLLTLQQDFTSHVDSRISLTILESLATRDHDEIHRECADEPLEFLMELCQKGCKDEKSLRQLLHLLPYFFEYSIKRGYSPRLIIQTLEQLHKRIYKRNYSVLVHTSYMKCACSCVQIDPDFSWSHVGVSDNNDDVLMILNSILSYIDDALFVLRSQAVRCLQELLSLRNIAYKWKERIFVKVEETVFKLLDETAQQSNSNSRNNSLIESQLQDERETRTVTALIALASIVCASGVLQGRALCALLRLTTEKEVNVQMVRKVLLAAARHTTTYVSLIEDNLNYLLTSWIEDAHCLLQSFPWTLVGCETINEFFKKNINCIVPVLLRTSDIDEAMSFCTNHAGVAFNQVFEDAFPSCFVWLISRAVVFDSPAVETMRKMINNTDEFADTRSFNHLFRSRLQDVLIELIRRLHDEGDFSRVLSISSGCFPAMDPPHFSRDMLNLCFNYLESHNLLNTRVLVVQQPATLQKTLLQLASAVHLSRSREDKLKRLHQYTYFCLRLTHDFANPVFNEMAAFLIRDICYSLLHLIRNGGDGDETLVTACCRFLNLFLRQALPTRAAEVQDVLRFIVANLIGLAQSKTSSVSEIATSLLRFLVVEQKDVLREAIAKLGSFPNHEVFRDARKAHNTIRSEDGSALRLEDELERFLDAMSEENAECTLEDLTNFTQQLSMRKSELRELHRKLERPYPEDGASILHRLIFKLIKLTESPNPCVSMEATKCLGEIGPMDSTVALRPAGSLVRKEDDPIEALTYRSVAMLTSFLVENSVELRKVSADALYAVLSTSYGRELVENSKDLSNVLECAPLKIDYIRPFIHGRYVKQTSFHVDTTRFRTIMNPENTLWTVQNGDSYAEWIIKVTCNIAECFADSYLENLLSVCRLSVEFCELILPRIVYLVIHANDSFINAMCDCVNQFFRKHFALNEPETTTASPTSKGDSCDQKIVRRMLDIVNHVRAQLPDGTILRLNYIYLARAAHKCSAYYTALLFAQLACELISSDYPDFSNDPRIDYIYERQPEIGRVLQNIMLDTYLNISDPDAKSGAGSSHLLDHDSRVQYYARINRWDEVMLAQDIELSNHSSVANARLEMANALHHSGLQFLQWQFLGNNLDEKFSYECAWRLGKWNLPVNVANYNDFQSHQLRLESLENAFHVHHYHALKCFHENDRRSIDRAIECGRMSVINELRVISPESSKTVNQILSQLRLLREIEQLNWAADLPEERYPQILRRWNEHEISSTGQFDYVEPILWQRITMFRIRESLRTNVNVQKAFFATCLGLAKVAETQGNFSVATRALRTLQMHQNLPVNLKNQLVYQESLLAWMNNEQVIARRLLRTLIEKKNPRPDLKAKALRVYGDWMAETKSENPQAVIQKYYLISIEISEAIDEQTPDVVKNLHDTQVALARFADAQYQQITAYMNSPTFEALKEYAHSNTNKVVQAQMMKNQDLRKAVIIDQKQSTNDAAELKNIEQERHNYLAQALKYYLKTLCSSEEHNLLIFRLVALWLDNMYDDKVNEELLDELDTVPSFKFVPLVPQLAAHISNDFKQQRSFSARIFRILERCALEHPYHTLPVVLALKNLHSDNEYESGPSTVAKKEERRVLGAKKLLSRITDSSVRTIVHEMENLSRALLSFAYWQPKGTCQSNKRFPIARDQPISKIKNLNNVLLPTLSLLVRPSCNYVNVIGIHSYKDSCEFVGGVTAPKKIICVGTDGVQRRQLVKGKDDLRQDAVMQQVFTVINTLLRTCKETQRRNLRIRTYKVVPLTQRSGVLEWCDNTVPIAATLVYTNSDAPGLHKKYYPQDLTAKAAREKLMKVAQESNEVKLRIFLECCKRMKPAFHHFFEEKYRSPETWVERTLTYTRSVATTSIAGYILGLGDRHLSNILIDEHTAEVVHIDFGVAFEQGKVLPLPETIPFRLTRDIEVAMGVSGIEGTMRRSCEVTMTMLRDQRQIIITLLQVLLYDPLFTWAITPEKACKMQSDVVKRFLENSGRAPVETNTIAKRALLRIEQKLQGTEDGLVSSVPGQVERLLQEARDPANLCRVYCGWQPYL